MDRTLLPHGASVLGSVSVRSIHEQRLLTGPACEKVDLMERTELTTEQRAWAERVEPLWRRAHAIVACRPDLDVSDVFHALRNLERTPTQRLRRALGHGRNRAHGG
jgi:hypothetical protein